MLPVSRQLFCSTDQKLCRTAKVKLTSCLGTFHTRDNHRSECARENHKGLGVEEHECSTNVDRVGGDRIAVISDGVIPAEEDNHAGEDCSYQRCPSKMVEKKAEMLERLMIRFTATKPQRY